MTDYSIQLTNFASQQLQNAIGYKYPELRPDIICTSPKAGEFALSVFDTDGKKGLSSDEVSQLYDYFVQKEKEVAVSGKKGDGVITSKDIEYIVENDSKFSKIREKLDNTRNYTGFLYSLLKMLSAEILSKINITEEIRDGFNPPKHIVIE